MLKIVALVLVSISLPLHAAPEAVDVQGELLGVKSSCDCAKVSMEAVLSIPDYPSVDPVIFNKLTKLKYKIIDNSIAIDSKTIGTFYSELNQIPKTLGPMTLAITVVDEKVGATWDKDLNVNFSEITLYFAIYKKKRHEITEKTKPALEFTIEGVELIAEEVDIEEKYVILSFSEILPKTDNDLFNEYLSRKKIESEIEITLK